MGFLSSVHRHLARRWSHDRSAAADHVGTALYSDMRRAELQAIEGAGYIAQQYGLSVSWISTPREHQAGLRIANGRSAKYHRTIPGEGFFEQCMSVYNALGHSHPADQTRFANSLGMARKAREILGHGGGRDPAAAAAGGPVLDIKPLAHGLVAIEFNTPDEAHRGEKLLEILGGPPSIAEVMKRAHPVPRVATTPDPRIDNAAALAVLLRTDGPVAALARLPEGHAMQAAACAASLLAGLGQALEHQACTPAFKHDPLIANALSALANVADALPTLAGDSPRFFAGHAAMLEELNVLLAAAQPYSKEDFKKAARTMLDARAGGAFGPAGWLRVAEPETFLFSSGMEALLSRGLDAAGTLNGSAQFRGLTDQVNQPLYFEVFKLLRFDAEAMAGREVFMASLNASLPGREGRADEINNWDARKLVRAMQEWLTDHELDAHRPAVLILDTTVEAQGPGGTSDLAAVLAGLKDPVNDGMLKILLCKSHQKYTMGSGKVMAGAVTMIARDDGRTEAAARQLKDAEEDLDWMQNDESQLLTHLLTHAHASELALIGNAAKNAAFIDEVCLRTGPQAAGRSLTRREDALPFIVADFRAVGVRDRRGTDVVPVPVLDQVTPQFMRRSGFGYLPTVGFPLSDTQWRVTAGQETPEELAEKFYSFGWLNEANVETLTTAAVLSQAHRIADEAAQAICDIVDVGEWAEAALHVLRYRAGQGSEWHAAALGECKALFDQVDAGGSTGARSRQLKGELREKLKTGLLQSKGPAEDLLADRLRIIGAAFAPRLPDSARAGGDVEVMRAAIQRTPDGFGKGDIADPSMDRLRVALAPNMVASLLKLVGTAFGPQNASDADRPALEAFYQGALAAGLPRVSPSTRSQIVLAWSRLQVQKLADGLGGEGGRIAVEKLLRHVHLVPYREDKAAILASIPDRAFTALDPSVQRRLVADLFDPLDAYSRLEFIKTLSGGESPGKAAACLARFKADLEGTRPQGQKMLHPHRMSGQARVEILHPQPIMADEQGRIQAQLHAMPVERRQ